MTAVLAPRNFAVVIWLLLASMVALCAALLLQGPPRLPTPGTASEVARTHNRQLQQSLADLESLAKIATTAPAPLAAQTLLATAPSEAHVKADAPPVIENEAALKGAVVVLTDTHRYIVIGPQRYRVGDALPGGEIIKRIRPDSVDIALPKGRSRVIKLAPAPGALMGSPASLENHEKKH